MHRPVRFLPVVLVLCAASPLGLPAHAAMTYTPCLADAQANDLSPSCVTESSLGPVTSPPPPGEYLDPITGLVYAQTNQGFVPVGLGTLAQFVEHAGQSPFGCNASDVLSCPDAACSAMGYPATMLAPVSAANKGGAGASCQDTHVALVGCYDVEVDYKFSSAVDWGSATTWIGSSYYSGCTPVSHPAPLPVGAHGNAGAPSQVVCVQPGGPCLPTSPAEIVRAVEPNEVGSTDQTPYTTSIADAVPVQAACWYMHADGTMSQDPNYGWPMQATMTAVLHVYEPGTQTDVVPSVLSYVEVC
ncbi:MAG: hypothetical protein QOE90_2850 [Thermoplasmata archaeon]|jgi:hypothetical protein|nr:hypothetical protein [Thermoplasmata archaeon]